MIMADLVGRIRYPDESPAGFDDRIPYDDIVEGLRIGLETAKGQLATDLQDTFAELERRWAMRQRVGASARVTAQ